MKKIYFIIILFCCVLTVLYFFADLHIEYVNSIKMYPTIKEDEFVVLDTKNNLYTYGDIVYYHYKDPEIEWFDYYDFLRVVALPGDNISVKDDLCVINGHQKSIKVRENKLSPKGFLYDEYEEEYPNGVKATIWISDNEKEILNILPIVVQKKHYFLIGDLRTGNFDSRQLGSIAESNIQGKIVRIEKSYWKAVLGFYSYLIYGK